MTDSMASQSPHSQQDNVVCVVGLGYVGLPTAVLMARSGALVAGYDIKSETVAAVNAGLLPIVEPGLADLLGEVVRSGRLAASTSVTPADAFVIAVPTPIRDDRTADVSFVKAGVMAVAEVLTGVELIVLESTVPPGTTEKILTWIRHARPDLDLDGLDIAHCPERVLPGNVVVELQANDRIVGGMTPRAGRRAARLFSAFSSGEMVMTDCRTAELAKVVENSYRDVNIAFANELAAVCGRVGVDVWELIRLANHHPRVNILNPGPGVGGHCIAVDPWFIVEAAPEEAQLIATARRINDARPAAVAAEVNVAIAEEGATCVALLGLAYKRDIDDFRGSPAVEVADLLVRDHPEIDFIAVEPNANVLPDPLAGYGNIRLGDIDTALDSCSVVVLLVDHSDLDTAKIARAKGRVLDTRGVLRSHRVGAVASMVQTGRNSGSLDPIP